MATKTKTMVYLNFIYLIAITTIIGPALHPFSQFLENVFEQSKTVKDCLTTTSHSYEPFKRYTKIYTKDNLSLSDQKKRQNAQSAVSFTLIDNSFCRRRKKPWSRVPKYPCQICNRAVTWKQRGVACDERDK